MPCFFAAGGLWGRVRDSGATFLGLTRLSCARPPSGAAAWLIGLLTRGERLFHRPGFGRRMERQLAAVLAGLLVATAPLADIACGAAGDGGLSAGCGATGCANCGACGASGCGSCGTGCAPP